MTKQENQERAAREAKADDQTERNIAAINRLADAFERVAAAQEAVAKVTSPSFQPVVTQ